MSSYLELMPPYRPVSLKGLRGRRRHDAMVEWFHGNFEDPANHTPFESAEGGYLYIWGGPYDAREELTDHFPDATEKEIDRVVASIEQDGTIDWAPHSSRIQPNDDDDDDDKPTATSIDAQVAALGGQLDEIEKFIDALGPSTPGIGHNRPPEAMQMTVEPQELAEVKQSILEIRAELSKADPVNSANPAPLEKAEGRFRALARKMMGWLTKAVSGGVEFLAKGALGEAGRELVFDPHALATKLGTVADTLTNWVHHLHLPF